MNNAIGLGIILSLQDRASSELNAIRNKMTALRDVSQEMMKNFDEGAKRMVAGFASMATGAKVIGFLNTTFGVSVSTAAEFEQAMARVGAVSGAVGEDFERLSKQSRDLGRDTQYSATQAANSQELLARAGFQTNEILSAMPHLLYMAGAEGMDLARAADIASNTLRGFGLEAAKMNEVANVLAKTSSITNTSIDTLGESFKKFAPYAKAVNISLKQSAAMIGVVGDAGIKGSEAGTAVTSAIRRLATEPKAVAETLKSLGISAKDAKGNFVGFEDLMERVHAKINKLGDMQQMNILSRIFRGVSGGAMLALMNATVSGKLKDKIEELNNMGDAAKEMYDKMIATFQGAQKRLESATEGMRIAIGNHLLPVYTKGIDALVQFKSWLTQLIEAHPILSKAVIGFTASLLALSGTALILVGALASIDGMIKMWSLMRKMAVYALASIRSQARMALSSLSGLSVPVVGMIALAGALYYAWRKNLWGIRDMVEAVTQGFKFAWNASTDGIAEIDDNLAKKLKVAGIFDYAVTMGQVFFRVRQFWNGLVDGFKEGLDFLMGAFDWLKGIFSPVIESGQELLKFLGILKPVTETHTETWKAWGQLLGRFAPAVIGVITAFKGMRIISGIFGDLGKAILGMFHLITAHPIIALITIIAGLAVYVYNHWDEITAYVSEKWQKITGLCTQAADWVKRKWQALSDWWNSWTLADVFAPLTNWVNDAIGKVRQKIDEFSAWWDSWTLPDIFAVLGGYVDNIISTIKGKWQEFTNWLSSLNPFANWSAPAPESVKVGNQSVSTGGSRQVANAMAALQGNMPGMATGGIVDSPVLSWIGEAGREAVIPLEDTARGTVLWIEAGRELGLIPSNNAESTRLINPVVNIPKLQSDSFKGANVINNTNYDVLPEIVNALKFQPENTGIASYVKFSPEAGHETRLISEKYQTLSMSPNVNTAAKREIPVMNAVTSKVISQSYNVVPNIVNALKFQPDVSFQGVQKAGNRYSSMNTEIIKNFAETNIISNALTRSNLLNTKNRRYTLPSVVNIQPPSIESIFPQLGRDVHELKMLTSYSEIVNALKLKPEVSNVSSKEINNYSDFSMVRDIVSSTAENLVTQNFAVPVIPHAMGGIFSAPHIGLVAEAGREAVIPLEDKSRGIPLLMAAANEMIGENIVTNQPYSMPVLIQHFQNQAAMSGQASSQTMEERGERQSASQSKVTVNVDVKPADVYIDGERIGRISFRWSERQSIRSGIGS